MANGHAVMVGGVVLVSVALLMVTQGAVLEMPLQRSSLPTGFGAGLAARQAGLAQRYLPSRWAAAYSALADALGYPAANLEAPIPESMTDWFDEVCALTSNWVSLSNECMMFLR